MLEQTGDEWGLAAHDSIRARNLAVRGELDAAEASARASVDQLRGIGEQWLVFEGLGSLAIIIEARGDLERAAATYEELVAEAHDAGVPNYEALWVFRLAGVRARQGQDDEAARCFVIAAAERAPAGQRRVGADRGIGSVSEDGRRLPCRRAARRGAAAVRVARPRPGSQLPSPAGAGARRGRARRRRWSEAVGERGYGSRCAAIAAAVSRSRLDRTGRWRSPTAGRSGRAAADVADAARLAGDRAESRFAAAAGIVGAAVSYARSCSAGDRDAFLKLVDERSRAGTWRYDLMLGGTVGEYFDEPDVAAFVQFADVTPEGGLPWSLVEVRLLGELEVDAQGATVEVRGTKARTLLAVLALHRGEPVAPDRLIDILWGDEPPGNPAQRVAGAGRHVAPCRRQRGDRHDRRRLRPGCRARRPRHRSLRAARRRRPPPSRRGRCRRVRPKC